MLRIFEWNRSGIRFRMSGEFRVENVKLPFYPWVTIYQNTPECFCPFLCCFSSVWHVASGPERGSTGLTRFSFPLTGYPVRRYFLCVLISRKTLSPLLPSSFRDLLRCSVPKFSSVSIPLCLRRYSSLIPSKRHPLHRELVLPSRLRFWFSPFSVAGSGTRLPRVPRAILRRIDPLPAKIASHSLILVWSFLICVISVRTRTLIFQLLFDFGWFVLNSFD